MSRHQGRALLAIAIAMLSIFSRCPKQPFVKYHQMSQQSFHFSPDVIINFEVDGEGPRPLLMLHGFGASLESWKDIQPYLRTNFRVYALDLKGHGLSSKPHDNKYSPQDQADIVTAFIKNRQLTDVVLVGHSYGGGVALLAFLRLSEHTEHNPVSTMILIDSASYPQPLPFFCRQPSTTSIE